MTTADTAEQTSADTGTGTGTDERPITADGDHERFSHIIRKADEMRGYVMGEEVTALCGKRWVPSRDPQRYPVCPTCREVLSSLP